MIQPHNILVVDDDPIVLKTTSRALRNEGYQVDIAVSAAEALAILPGSEIDLIVCDHRMPGRSGLDLLAEIHSSYPHIVSILLSGGMHNAQVVQAETEIGVFSVLAKPCSQSVLCATVKSAIESRDMTPVATSTS